MFDELISERLIEWIWILGSIGVVINGIILMIASGSGWGILLALIFIVVGLLVVRVLCESMIVIFKIHDNLQQSTRALEELQRHQYIISSKLTAQPVPQAAQSAVSATPRPAVAEPPRIAQPARKGGWESAYDSTKE